MGVPVLLSPQVVASGVGAIGSLASSFLNGAFNRSSIASQVEASKDLMKYQWDNFMSPRAQVNSMAAAGINPAVALGQGGTGFSASPSVGMPSSSPPQISGISDIGSFASAIALTKLPISEIPEI